MAYRITGACNQCGDCVELCPNHAIVADTPVYRILAYACTECVGYADDAVCVRVCEPRAIVLDLA